MQILNIDAFAQTNRQISLGGKTYPVEELSVQQFIDNLKASEALANESEMGQTTLVKSFEQAVVAIVQAIPTMPESTVRALKLPAMTAVLHFIRGELDPAALGAGDNKDAIPGDLEKKPS